MQYEIIRPGSGPDSHPRHPRVRIGGRVYPLITKGGATLDGRQLAAIEAGDYGELAQAYLCACREVGEEARFGWRGIINALGDFAEVTLPDPVSA